MPPKLMGDPKSWRKFIVALLPHNNCYERHTDDHIKHILDSVLQLSNDDGATPRNKSVITRLDTTDSKSIQDRMKEDEKNGSCINCTCFCLMRLLSTLLISSRCSRSPH